jgi:D-alanine transaminase
VIVHLNDKLVPAEEAFVSAFDRGFIFGDGVYEGLRSIRWDGGDGRRIVGVERHIERMRRGLEATGIEWSPRDLDRMTLELLEANGLADAFVYWQVTRGTPSPGMPVRSRVPGKGMRPTVFGYCSPQPALESFVAPPTKSAATCEDKRWLLGRLKCTSLMGNVLASMEADAAGAEDAIFVRDGVVTEGLATNVIVVDQHGRIATPSLDSAPMLAGVTRAVLLEEVSEIEERPIREPELAGAAEIILTGTTTMVTSVIKLDGRVVGDGTPGPAARRLLGALVGAIRAGRDGAGRVGTGAGTHAMHDPAAR